MIDLLKATNRDPKELLVHPDTGLFMSAQNWAEWGSELEGEDAERDIITQFESLLIPSAVF